jgi:hypothetical protein
LLELGIKSKNSLTLTLAKFVFVSKIPFPVKNLCEVAPLSL